MMLTLPILKATAALTLTSLVFTGCAVVWETDDKQRKLPRVKVSEECTIKVRKSKQSVECRWKL